jgi:hypothetical protein
VNVVVKENTNGLHLEAEHPVDEALGCMVPISVATTIVVVFMVLMLGG